MNKQFLTALCACYLLLHPAGAAAIDIDYFSKNARMVRAAEDNNSATVMQLLNEGADINYADSRGNTALINAVSKGNVALVRFLVQRGANIHRKYNESTALVWAVRAGRSEIARILIDGGADVHDSKDAAMLQAAKLGLKDIVPLLIGKGANVNAVDTYEHDMTPLLYAAKNNHIEVVRQLVEARADIDAKYLGETAFWSGVKKGQVEIVRILARAGADLNRVYGDGWTPLMLAAEWGKTDVAVVLLESGAFPDGDAYALAMRKNNSEMVKMLRGAQKNIVQAAATGQVEAVQAYIKQGADIDIFDHRKFTALMWAARLNDAKMITLLMESGADILLRNGQNTTAYSLANQTSINSAMKEALEKIGKFIDAAGRGDVQSVRSFLDAGLSPDCADRNGVTPIISAAKQGKQDVVYLLLERGARISENIWDAGRHCCSGSRAGPDRRYTAGTRPVFRPSKQVSGKGS